MTEIVQRARPAKHGKTLHNKLVIIHQQGNLANTKCGTYIGGNKTPYFIIRETSGDETRFLKKSWTVEEIVETEEKCPSNY